MRYVTAVSLSLLIFLLLAACQQAPDPVNGGFVIGEYALVPRESSLHVVNIANASKPRFTTLIKMPGYIDDLAIFGDQAYIDYLIGDPSSGYYPGGLQIVDVSDPQEPALAQAYGLNTMVNDFLVTGDQGFRVDYDGITLLNMQNLDSIGADAVFGTRAVALSHQDDDLFGLWGGCGFRTPLCYMELTRYDLTDTQHITATAVVTSTVMPGYDLLIIDQFAIIGGLGVGVIDMNQTPPTLNSHISYEETGNIYTITQLAHQGNILYVLQDRILHLLDTTNLPQLTEVGAVEVAYSFPHLTVRGDFAYIAGEYMHESGTAAGLFIVNVADAERPFVASYYDALTQP